MPLPYQSTNVKSTNHLAPLPRVLLLGIRDHLSEIVLATSLGSFSKPNV